MWVLLCALVPVALTMDLLRPPSAQLSTAVLLSGIRLYRQLGSAYMARLGARCRFEPSCSRYAEVVLTEHGAARGSLLVVHRILRCGPWTEPGQVDPPPHSHRPRRAAKAPG